MKDSEFKIGVEDIDDRSIFINWSKREREEVFRNLLSMMTLTEFSRRINYDLPTLSEIKNGTVKPSGYVYVSLSELLGFDIKLKSLTISSRNSKPIRIVNEYIEPQLLGLIHSDGFLVERNKKVIVSFSNKSKNMVNLFKRLASKTFECNFSILKDKRDGTYYIYLPSVVGRILLNKFAEKTTKKLNIPELLDKEIPAYIRGVFDGDGTIYLYKGKSIIPTIRITSGYKPFSLELKDLLEKIDINSRICHESRRNSEWYNVTITRQRDFLRFIEKIGSNHTEKRKKMVKIRKFLSNYVPSPQPVK